MNETAYPLTVLLLPPTNFSKVRQTYHERKLAYPDSFIVAEQTSQR
jgi:hypothetical protein